MIFCFWSHPINKKDQNKYWMNIKNNEKKLNIFYESINSPLTKPLPIIWWKLFFSKSSFPKFFRNSKDAIFYGVKKVFNVSFEKLWIQIKWFCIYLLIIIIDKFLITFFADIFCNELWIISQTKSDFFECWSLIRIMIPVFLYHSPYFSGIDSFNFERLQLVTFSVNALLKSHYNCI